MTLTLLVIELQLVRVFARFEIKNSFSIFRNPKGFKNLSFRIQRLLMKKTTISSNSLDIARSSLGPQVLYDLSKTLKVSNLSKSLTWYLIETMYTKAVYSIESNWFHLPI